MGRRFWLLSFCVKRFGPWTQFEYQGPFYGVRVKRVCVLSWPRIEVGPQSLYLQVLSLGIWKETLWGLQLDQFNIELPEKGEFT